MFTDKDREDLAYVSKQIKATAQLVVDYNLRTEARVAGLEATVGVLANSKGLDPNLVQKTISDAVDTALSRIKLTTTEETP